MPRTLLTLLFSTLTLLMATSDAWSQTFVRQWTVPNNGTPSASLAVDGSGNVFTAGLGSITYSKFSNTGTLLFRCESDLRIGAIAVDGAGTPYYMGAIQRGTSFSAQWFFQPVFNGTSCLIDHSRRLAVPFGTPLGIPKGLAVFGNMAYAATLDLTSKDPTHRVFAIRLDQRPVWSPYALPVSGGSPNIAVDPRNGDVIVAEGCRIMKFSPGAVTAKLRWGCGGKPGEFTVSPLGGGVTVDGLGNVYIADGANNRIQKFSSEGEFLTAWGSRGAGPGQFETPYAVGVDGAGFIYVLDGVRGRLQVFSPAPPPLLARPVGGPSVALTLNQSAIQTGDTLSFTVHQQSPGPETYVDVYVGAVRPGGQSIAFATSLFPLTLVDANADDPTTFQPLVTGAWLAPNLDQTASPFLQWTFVGDEPPGQYTAFVALTKPGALLIDGQLDPDAILASAAQVFTFAPTP